MLNVCLIHLLDSVRESRDPEDIKKALSEIERRRRENIINDYAYDASIEYLKNLLEEVKND